MCINYMQLFVIYTMSVIPPPPPPQQVGNLQSSYKSAKKSLEVFPEHVDSKELLKTLEQHFVAL